MKLRVVSDGSAEGQYLKKEFEREDISDSLNNSFEIMWGDSNYSTKAGTIFNSRAAVKNTLDKEQVILLLKKNHINCPRWLKPGRKTEFPILGRNYQHKNGADIKVIEALEEYRICNSDYFIDYIKFIEEYRIHVMDTKVFFVEEKYKPSSFSKNIGVLNKAHYISKLKRANSFLKFKNFSRTEMFNNDFNSQSLIEAEGSEDSIIRTEAFGWKMKQTTLFNKSEEDKKVIYNLAKRAVYCLGLDFGVVSIGRDLNGRYYVLDVDATCINWSESCRNAYICEFEKLVTCYDQLQSEKKRVTIGADPEFILKNTETNSMVFASDFFANAGDCGLDSRSIESGKRYFPLVEVRPQPSTDPLQVIQSIKSLLEEVVRVVHYKNIGLFAGSMPIDNYWVGGHIHFGTKVNGSLLRALDNYLALPLMMIENVASSRKRKNRYGELGDYRVKSYGGFEYRTLSSWIISPQIATAVMCLAKVVIEEYWDLDRIFISNFSDIRAFYKVNKYHFKDKVLEVINILSSTKTYKKYSEQIRPLFKMIEQGEEWGEGKDIKEAWNLSSSSNIYKPTFRCFIPRLSREKFNLELESTNTFLIGNNKYKLTVYPKDDFSFKKDNYITFSEDICKTLGITETDGLSFWFDNTKDLFRAGPTLGILSYISDHTLGPFGFQSSYFKKLIKFARTKGMIAYVFTIWETDWSNDRIKGYTYDFEKDQWLKKYFPAPDIIYDRGDVINEDNYGKRAVDYINYVKKHAIKFINSLECINLTNDKWETYKLLSSVEGTADYQIDTIKYTDNSTLKKYIDCYNHIFLKLRNGSRSKGIFSIEKLKDGNYSLNYKDSTSEDVTLTVNESKLFSIIKDEFEQLGFSKTDYIIQKAIKLSKYKGRSFEIRVVMQKNGDGDWYRTCMVSRSADVNSKFMSLVDEEDTKSSLALSTCFGENAEMVANKLRLAAKLVVQVLDKNEIGAGEIAIDFGIDDYFNIYVIELNSKPDNLLSSIGAFRMRNMAMYRILEYGRYLATN